MEAIACGWGSTLLPPRLAWTSSFRPRTLGEFLASSSCVLGVLSPSPCASSLRRMFCGPDRQQLVSNTFEGSVRLCKREGPASRAAWEGTSLAACAPYHMTTLSKRFSSWQRSIWRCSRILLSTELAVDATNSYSNSLPAQKKEKRHDPESRRIGTKIIKISDKTPRGGSSGPASHRRIDVLRWCPSL